MAPEEERRSDRDWFAVDNKGRVREEDPPRRRGPPLIGVLAGVVVIGVGGIAVVNKLGATDPPRPTPTVSATSGAPRAPIIAPIIAPTIAPTIPVATGTVGPSITTVGHPLLGVTGGWNLFAEGPNVLIRIELAGGRVETTPVPSLGSGGPVSFIAGPDRVLIRPIDDVPGYVVPDGRPAEVAKGALASGGFVFPGPDPAHVWAQAGTEAKPVLSLVGFDGSSSGGPWIPIPPDMSPFQAQPDGSGSLILQGTSGSYAANGDGLHRITTGQVLAASAHGWLVSDCDDRHQCSTALMDRATGARHALGPGLAPNAAGRISPDGRLAAVAVAVADGWTLLVIDLTSGTRRQAPASLTSSFGEASLAWSPDSRQLLVVASDHTIRVIDPTTLGVSSLGVKLPPVDQVAVRP